jgi:hypothetical protein
MPIAEDARLHLRPRNRVNQFVQLVLDRLDLRLSRRIGNALAQHIHGGGSQPCRYRVAQTEGLIHTSPGQRPGFIRRKEQSSAESASHTVCFTNVVCAFPIAFGRSISTASPTLKADTLRLNPTHIARRNRPDIYATIRDIPPETFSFDDATPDSDITHQVIELTIPNGETAVTSLPEKRSVLIGLRLSPC